jgi:beta-glucanase (GH16 family)
MTVSGVIALNGSARMDFGPMKMHIWMEREISSFEWMRGMVSIIPEPFARWINLNKSKAFFEIRCKLQTQEGFWGAFWLMSPTVAEVGDEGRDGTEIDIMESAYLKSSKICQALHWDGYEDDHKSDSNIPYIPYIYEGYHTFAVNWTEYEYVFYVDDQPTWITSAGGVSQVPAYLKITAEVGDWAGDIKNAKLPDYLVVDYVRVYQKPGNK